MCSLEKREKVFILRLTGDGEHRFNPPFTDSILSAVNYVNLNAHEACALVTTNDGKYFSNGIDLQWASHDKETGLHSAGAKFSDLLAALMNLKLPSIAAVCGHASAGGFIFALAHDYIFMRKDRGFLYMSEIDVGLTIPPFAMSVIRSKVDSRFLTELLLKGLKYTADVALQKGLVHSVHANSDETLEAAVNEAVQLGKRKWNGEVYRGLRVGAFPKAAEELQLKSVSILPSRL